MASDLDLERQKLEKQMADLQRQIEENEAKAKERRKSKMALIGECVVRLMETDSALKQRIQADLERTVKGKRNRDLLGLGKQQNPSHLSEAS